MQGSLEQPNDDPSRITVDGFPVVVRLSVQWSDLDVYGHVNNGAFLRWFETARAVYASHVGVAVLPGQSGVGAVLASLSCSFHRQLSFPADVLVGVRVARMSLGSVRLECEIVQQPTKVPLASAACDVVLYDHAAGRPVPISDSIHRAVEALEQRTFRL